MKPDDIERISAWLATRGLEGERELALLNGFCERCQSAGLGLSRAIVLIDTLHPIYEGRAFRWRDDDVEEPPILEFGRVRDANATENWNNSPFNHLLQAGGGEIRCRLHADEISGFQAIEELREEGQTDYFALVHRFAPDSIIGEMDAFSSRWTTAKAGGFHDDEIVALRRLVPLLGLAIKAASLARVAELIVEAYLGRDAGRKVLQGRVTRGVAEKIRAVIWFSDMKGYTSLSDTIPARQIIPLLDDYAEAVVSAIHGAGGDVLKLIGDGVLAIFTDDDPAIACASAFKAEADLRRRAAELSLRRVAAGEPVASIYIGLHIGDVFYGNIGSPERLDFTVVGPAVNEVSRIAALCGSVDRDNLFSSDFAAALPDVKRSRLVSVGRYALRGVGRAQELFTLDPESIGESPLR